ncbi:3-deoxy-D-manno-octulosonic acid transferase [Pontibacter qinzhouensis]|uniref:3-deoxy-D-manno-octulosonic acid transferase n=1 Tax=Pontibacter qinzhouensis TaxID=2603253 RepID=A0A5C8K9H9_9BACT|nr:glycosyltransferase N-terminal domain-containing protein [Pontibacter qinzhouensis]TXK48033.1 3-deoxy-D-manno-octulosonic acid transferase [Pontibacter qinzhouensis]
MKLLYDIGLQTYKTALALAAPFHQKARQMRLGRAQQAEQLERALQQNSMPLAWFHCASLGEFEQGRPLIEAFKADFPAYKILLTFFSPSGYEVRKNYAAADYVFYLPLDSQSAANRFVELAKPKLAVFVKYEFWHYYMQALQHHHIPAISVSAIFRPGQLFFRPYGGFYRNILKGFTHIFTQNQASAKLLQQQQIQQVSVAGDTRFDRVLQTAAAVKPIPVVAAFVQEQPVFMIGSSWPADIDVLLPLIQKYSTSLKFIIAPHEVTPKSTATLSASLGAGAIRFSEAEAGTVAQHHVLVIDNVGMLSSLYSYGTYAYIGGAFGAGLHNTLEAAVFGLPLFFGPRYDKFQEAKDLVDLGCAFPVKTSAELLAAFEQVHLQPEKRQKISETEKQYVHKQAGATAKIMTAIKQLLPPTA